MFNIRSTSSNRKLLGFSKIVRRVTDVLFWVYKAKAIAGMFGEIFDSLS